MGDIAHEIEETERRVRRRWSEDGLAETFGGALMLLAGGYLVGLALLPAGRLHNFVLTLAPVVLVGLGVLGNRLIRLAKDWYVYPQTGYVAFKRGPAQSWRSALIGGGMGFLFAVVSVVTRRVPGVVSPLPAIYGVVFALLYFYETWRMRVGRFTIEAVIVAMFGLALSFVHVDPDVATGLFIGGLGLLTATGGLLAFRAFLKNTRRSEES